MLCYVYINRINIAIISNKPIINILKLHFIPYTTNYKHLYVFSTEEIFLQEFLVNLKHPLQNY